MRRRVFGTPEGGGDLEPKELEKYASGSLVHLSIAECKAYEFIQRVNTGRKRSAAA